MLTELEVLTEHLGGTCVVRVTSTIEPNQAAYNHSVYREMVDTLNGLLTEMFTVRAELRFDQEITALRTEPSRADDEKSGRADS